MSQIEPDKMPLNYPVQFQDILSARHWDRSGPWLQPSWSFGGSKSKRRGRPGKRESLWGILLLNNFRLFESTSGHGNIRSLPRIETGTQFRRITLFGKKMHLLKMFSMVLVSLLGVRAAQPEFSGYIKVGDQVAFYITIPERRVVSGPLQIGQSFRGYEVAAFDPKIEILTVSDGDRRYRLPLLQSATEESSASGLRGIVTEYGVYQNGWIEAGASSTDSNGEKIVRGLGGEFVGSASRIEIKKGLKFGFFADLLGLPPSEIVELEYLYATPPVKFPDGRISQFSYFTDTHATDDEGVMVRMGSYVSLLEDYELVPGRYRLEIRYKSKLLAAREFDLYFPERTPQKPNSESSVSQQPTQDSG